MSIPLIDIVFQNDRYYLLFDHEDSLETVKASDIWYVYTDGEYLCCANGCTISEILKVQGKIVLETKTNLNLLENLFRKFKNVILTSNKINL
jgi:hypothetical protein